MNDKLLPCPFCGSEANCNNMGLIDENSVPLWWVVCLECKVSTHGSKTKDEAIAVWNTRTAPEPRALTITEVKALPFLSWVWLAAVNPTQYNTSRYQQKQYDHTGDAFCCGYPGVSWAYDYADYGKTWLVYDREPRPSQREPQK